MYLGYCQQILYKSTVPFKRFSISTKRCQKVRLPVAILTGFTCTRETSKYCYWPSLHKR